MTTDETRKYELMLILSGEMTESDIERELGEIKKLLKESSKGILYEESWGKRNLAYRIKKQSSGYYVFFDFEALGTELAELRMTIKLNPVVLRHLLVSLPQDYIPGRYKELVLRDEQKGKSDDRRRSKQPTYQPRPALAPHQGSVPAAASLSAPEALTKPKVAGKQEEEALESVEKKLEKILENPDIDIR